MKCIRYTDGTIKRVNDVFAEIDVKNGSAKHVCKKMWKEATRPKPESKLPTPVEEPKPTIKRRMEVVNKKPLKAKERHAVEKRKKTRRDK